MSNIDLASQIRFGDVVGLRTFLLQHKQDHDAIDGAIQTTQARLLTAGSLLSIAAEQTWVQLMVQPDEPTDQRALQDWLADHGNLHDSEYAALGLADAPDLTEVDFSKADQFYDWMLAHAQLHQIEKNVLGLS